MPSKTETVAKEIVEVKGLDPTLIIVLITIIAEIIKYLVKRNASKSVATMNNPGVFSRMILKRIVRKHAKKNRTEIYDALLEKGRTLKEDEFKQICQENSK